MRNYIYHIKLYLLRFLLVIAIFTLSRFIFYIFNIGYFSDISILELLKIHVAGLRFDLSALFYFNILFFLLSTVPGGFKNKKAYQKGIFILFVVVNSIILFGNIVDTKFFDFEHKRLTSEVFSTIWLGADFFTLLPTFIYDFWYLFIIWVSMILMLYKFYPKFKIDKIIEQLFKIKNISIQSLAFIVLMGLGVICGRGGLQVQPLLMLHAAEYTSARNISIVLNTPFTIMTTLGTESFQPSHYFSKEELDSIYSPVINLHQSKQSNPNVVIIIAESFSKEYIGALNNGNGYTPFLDSLIGKSLVFTNAFANGKRSVEAMPSIIAGLPALTERAYIVSEFVINKINSIPNLLKTRGYYTAFFHGGKNGTMGFDQFAFVSGFDDYFGKNEYPNQLDFDGNWGIYDEPYLQYFGNKLTEFKQPFFASVFTLSSHHPYEIPKKYNKQFAEGTLIIHKSIRYADYSLKKFFESIKNKEWYKNTLFIIVADHTAQAESPYYNSKLGNYAIPIILFHPGDSSFNGQSNIVAQQADIMPTILDYIGFEKPFVCFGNSLLNDSTEHYCVNYENGIYQYADSGYLIQYDGYKRSALFNVKEDSLLQHKIKHDSVLIYKYERKIKALIQSYQERIVYNKLTVE